MHIHFNKPFIAGKELYYIAQAVLEHKQISGDGAFTKKCENWLSKRFGASKTLLTHSCTAALEMAAILADLQPGDEVILPSYTFVSTANAFALRGAKLRFCEIRSDTLNIDETKIETLINERTRVIVPVHYAGVGCEMDAIMDIAKRHNLLVIEDAAQAVNATYKERFLGTLGHLGCYSFHETKNFISGEGGALVINDNRLHERAEMIREKGTNRSRFLRGQVDKYTWVDIGSSYLPSDMIAAFLYAQLEESERITQKRHQLFDTYYAGLKSLEAAGKIQLPVCPSHCKHNGHLFYVITENLATRTALLDFLKQRGIWGFFHYIPLHTSPMGKKLGCDEHLPITDHISDSLLRLPCFYEMSLEECELVIQNVREFYS